MDRIAVEGCRPLGGQGRPSTVVGEGRLKVIAAILEQPVIEKILATGTCS